MNSSARRLESFSSEVLATYLKRSGRAFSGDILIELEQIEASQEWHKLQAENELLIAQSRKYHGIEHIARYTQIQNKIDQNWKRQDGLQSVMYPLASTHMERFGKRKRKTETRK